MIFLNELLLLLRHERVAGGVVRDKDGPKDAPDDGQASVDVEDSLPSQRSGNDSRCRDGNGSPKGCTYTTHHF